jgi:hypothetical protein
MSQADSRNTTILPWQLLSEVFRDSFVADAFRRAERDHGGAFATPAPSPVLLAGGASVAPPHEAVEQAVRAKAGEVVR